MKAQKTSVALSVYNGEKFLGDLFHSILSQTHPVDEIIICDDASGDNSVAITEKFLRGRNYKIIRNDANLGIQICYSKAIAACSGDIIFLCDQDDVWECTKVEKILNNFTRNESAGMVFSDSRLVDDNLNDLGKTGWQAVRFTREEQRLFLRDRSFFSLLKRNVVTSSSTLAMRAKGKDIVLPIPPGFYPDYWLGLILSAAYPIMPVNELLVKYRLHGSNASFFMINSTQRVKQAWENKNIFTGQVSAFRELEKRLKKVRTLGYSISDTKLEALKDKIEHLSARAALPKNRIKRIPLLFREIFNKRYFTYSEGWKSVARDIVV